MTKAWAFLMALISSVRACGETPPRSALERVRAVGFQCEARAEGSLCWIARVTGARFRYSQPIVVLIPSGARRPSYLIAHLHGFRGVCERANATPAEMADNFALFPQMIAAGASDAALVMPISLGQCDTYMAELVPQYEAFVEWMRGLLDPSSDDMAISGHSGAYRPIGAIFGAEAKSNPELVRSVKSAILLDATYTTSSSYFNSWKAAAAEQPDLLVYSVYRSDTEAGSKMLKSSLPQLKVSIGPSAEPNHCKIPNRYFGPYLKSSLDATASRARHETD